MRVRALTVGSCKGNNKFLTLAFTERFGWGQFLQSRLRKLLAEWYQSTPELPKIKTYQIRDCASHFASLETHLLPMDPDEPIVYIHSDQ
jgi:hypothetical protein